ncbi:MAG: fasciclin domain-containing protein [Prolixibacteraceae bacterium]|nr:fasciclin domain-containing protein [Prolixibacteraceae bacterium]
MNIPVKNSSRIFGKLFLLLSILALFSTCKEEPEYWEKKPEDMVITDYIISKPEKYSEFAKMLENTGIGSLLSIRGPFTLFLPTNEALDKYCESKSVNSVSDLDSIFQRNLIYNHLIPAEISTGDIGQGSIRIENALGDKIASDFLNWSDIILNKESKITDRDIYTANGYVHEIDKVIEPLTQSVYDVVSSLPGYSIFSEGLELTNLSDTLDVIEFPFGQKIARAHFTLLAVPDTLYNRYGINSVNDLINVYTDDPAGITDLENGFYRYMEYHCLSGAYYFSDFETQLYPILSSDNNLSVTIDKDFMINFNSLTEEYTGFFFELSNFPAKNGAVHTVNKLLEVTTPEPKVITFEPTSYIDIREGDYYGKYYMKWYDGQNTFEKIKWEGDYLQYYFKDHDTGTLLNDDCLTMIGYWWIEITTPKIMKGKWKVSGNVWGGQNDYAIYVDGVKYGVSLKTDAGAPDMGTYEWDKTEEHKIKLVAITWGSLFWDTVTFTPVN